MDPYVREGAYHFYRREVYGVDRILCDGRIIFDHGVEVRLSRATFKKTFYPAIHSSMRSDNAFCCDGLVVSWGITPSEIAVSA